MKSILFFINTLNGGGAEKVIVDLVNSLDNTAYSVTLVTVSGGVHQKRLAPHVQYRQLVNCKISFFSKFFERCIFHLPKKWIYRLVAKGKYDIEIAYLEGFPTKVIAAGKSNAKKVAFVHCDVSVKPVLDKFYSNKTACCNEYRGYDKVCFVSDLARKGFEKVFGVLEDASVVHNVINSDEISQMATEKNGFSFQTDGLKIVSVGRLAPQKAFDRLVRIAARLEKKYEFEICILGEGVLRQQLETLISELDVKSVKLLGFKENPYSYMAKADLFVCSSLFEGYSTTVTECMLLHIPVLTTDCAGMDEILQNGEYGIITENDEHALQIALEKILQQKEILFDIKAKISQQESKDRMCEYDDLFKELLGE